jgi:hypothetical protein
MEVAAVNRPSGLETGLPTQFKKPPNGLEEAMIRLIIARPVQHF